MCLHQANRVWIFVPVCFEVNLVEFLPISFEGMSWHIQRPVYSLFTAAALFYLDIPHKNSIELCSVGCSLAAFEDEIFAGVFSGQRPTNLTVHMEQHQSFKLEQYLQYKMVLWCPLQGFEHQSPISSREYRGSDFMLIDWVRVFLLWKFCSEVINCWLTYCTSSWGLTVFTLKPPV